MPHDLRKVFRQVSNDLLRQFFEHEQCEMHVDWAKLTETRIESLFRAWTDLSDEQRQRTETVLEEIGEMAHIDALKVIVDEANKQAVGGALGTALEDRPSRADKAMLTYLQFPTVWDIAARFARTDMLARQRFWITRIGLPTRSPRTDSAAIDTFEKALSKHFVASEGRGHRCIVEFFPRTECLAYFFAYLDDFASMELHIDGHKGLAALHDATSSKRCSCLITRVDRCPSTLVEGSLSTCLCSDYSHARCLSMKSTRLDRRGTRTA
jgi:hypothetical protein